MPEVELLSEREEQGGWSFRLCVDVPGNEQVKVTLRLSWADYDLWSADGADPPHAVAEAAARFLLSRINTSDLPPTLDASIARRRFPDADETIPRLIRR